MRPARELRRATSGGGCVRSPDGDMQRSIERVIAAWEEPGPAPGYHVAMQNQLRKDWPVLANAVEEMVRATK